MNTRSFVLLLLGLVCGAGPAGAQPGPPVENFDLVLVGDHLRADVHRVALKTNPTYGTAWSSVDGARCTDTTQLMVIPDLSASRYLGQDIRENHLTLRITTRSSSTADGGALRAVYAMPSGPSYDPATCTRLVHRARTAPQQIRRYSLAAYERPRPASLRTDAPFLDHVEAPVRHRKPGVVETEWLNILLGESE